MNTNNGFWSYFWSVLTGVFATLTLQDLLFAVGCLLTGIFTWLTYRSNDRKNKAAIEEDRKRTEILKLAVARTRELDISGASKIVQEMDAAMRRGSEWRT